MKEIIAIVNRRGGVGKTVTAHSLGAGLQLKGNRVLLLDLDSQCNLSYDAGLSTIGLSSMDVLKGSADTAEAVVHTESIDILPASPALAGADQQIEGTGKEYRLKEALEPMLGEYDYCIIDTPPALGILTVNALTACNSVIIPVQAEIHSQHGISLIYDAITPVRKYCNPALAIKGILLTRYNSRTVLANDMRANFELMAQQIGTRVFSTCIRECNALKEAQAMQMDIFKYAPRSNGAKDYRAFVDEVISYA